MHHFIEIRIFLFFLSFLFVCVCVWVCVWVWGCGCMCVCCFVLFCFVVMISIIHYGGQEHNQDEPPWSTNAFFYGCENWTLNAKMEKRVFFFKVISILIKITPHPLHIFQEADKETDVELHRGTWTAVNLSETWTTYFVWACDIDGQSCKMLL